MRHRAKSPMCTLDVSGLVRSLKDPLPPAAEAKGEGFDVKILKEVIRIRKQDQEEWQEHESLLEVYLHALEDAEPVKKAA